MKNLRNQNLEITKTTDDLARQEELLKAELKKAEDRFPTSLAARVLGEITDSELGKERENLAQLKQRLAEIPLDHSRSGSLAG